MDAARHRLLLLAAAAASVVAPAAMLTGLESPVRVLAALILFGLAPGVALLPLLAPRPAPLELGLVVGTSIAISTVVAQAMLWFGAWSPTAATCLLAAACMTSVGPQLLNPQRGGG